MADKRIRDTFLTGPDHMAVCAIFKYDTSDSNESKEDQHKAIAAIYSVAEIYTLVDNEDNEYPAKLLVPKSAVKYQQSGQIVDADDLQRIMQKLLWEDERVVAFSVPKNSSGLSLLIENPIPTEGQPEMVKISLGP
jgi:hypothetical protein